MRWKKLRDQATLKQDKMTMPIVTTRWHRIAKKKRKRRLPLWRTTS